MSERPGAPVALIVAICAVVVAMAVVPAIFFKSYHFPTGSMAPTIEVGDHAIMRRTSVVKRGDIIVFPYPLHPKVDFAKRVVALPGETVEIRDKQLYVNGAAVREPYVIHDDPTVFPNQPSLPEPYRSRDQYGPYVVPPDQYFVLGDNRDRSADSRYWGTVPHNHVRGVIWYVLSPRRGFVSVHAASTIMAMP
jgi:signal peptidase I